jgi:hypothetical protein
MIDHFSTHGATGVCVSAAFSGLLASGFGHVCARVTLSWIGDDADAPAGHARVAARAFLVLLGVGRSRRQCRSRLTKEFNP